MSEALVDAALGTARGLAAAAEPAGAGLAWEAEVVIGVDGDTPVIGEGDVGSALYDGTAGIALALAASATASPGSDGLADAASGAARHALAGADSLVETGRLGLFDGAAGIALGAATAGRLLGEQALLDGAAVLANAVAERSRAILADGAGGAELDLIGGFAGIALGLHGASRALGDAPPVALLDAVAAHLAAAAVPQTWGAAWTTGGAAPGGPPLLGLGHGAAGIALALAEAGAVAGDDRASRACLDGLEYERGRYDAERVAWPDLRQSDGAAPGWMAAWCHGAIGIGLSRLRLAALTGDRIALAEASAALQAARNIVVEAGTALRSGSTRDCTACHGLAGVVELLLVAAAALRSDDHARAARRVASLLLEQRRAAGGAWPCGLPGAGEVPGLMLGSAGIVLTLLRAAGAVAVPTPLLPGPSGW